MKISSIPSDVQVIGVPDKDYGEELMACVILKEGEMREDTVKLLHFTDASKNKTLKRTLSQGVTGFFLSLVFYVFVSTVCKECTSKNPKSNYK